MLSTYPLPYRASWLATAMLFLTVLQGTSFTLTLAIRGPLASDFGSSLVTLVWLAMYMMATLGLFFSSGINWITWLVRYRLPLTLLVAGAAFSAAWSIDIGLTMERGIHLIGTTLVALYLGFTVPLARMLRISAVLLGLLMLASIAAALLLPELGQENYEGQQVWAGVMASKNTLGFWAAISVLLSGSLMFWHITFSQKVMYFCMAIASGICLIFSVSATSLLAMTTAALIMVYLHAAFSLRLGLISMLVLGILIAALTGMAFYFIDTAELIGRSGDLTGRGEVWAQTWQVIMDHPMGGVGYGTLWYPTDESAWIQESLTDFSWTVFHAHNGLLQVASEIGLPLTALAVFMIVQQLVEVVYCQYQRQQPGVLFVLGFMVALLISNYSEARLLVHRELYWVFFIALPISMLQQVNLFQTHMGVTAPPVTLPPDAGDRIKQGRDQLAKRRTLKKRLRKRRVTIINAPANTPEDTQAVAPGSLPKKSAAAIKNKTRTVKNTKASVSINAKLPSAKPGAKPSAKKDKIPVLKTAVNSDAKKNCVPAPKAAVNSDVKNNNVPPLLTAKKPDAKKTKIPVSKIGKLPIALEGDSAGSKNIGTAGAIQSQAANSTQYDAADKSTPQDLAAKADAIDPLNPASKLPVASRSTLADTMAKAPQDRQELLKRKQARRQRKAG